MRFSIVSVVFAIMAGVTGVRAADLQAKTIDGQVIQGEYLGTENNIVRIRTSYGVVSIPSKNIVTLLAVNLPDKPDPAPGAADEALVETLVFREPKNENLVSMLAARMPRIPEPDVRGRLELFRCVRNFGDSSDLSRQRIVRTLANYGLTAYPFIEASYTAPLDLDDKVELIQAVAGTHKPFSAQIFASVHASTLVEMTRTASQPPQLPYEVVTQRTNSVTREQRLRDLARDVRLIEGYAAASGGPFNALFLLDIYKRRYAGNSDALLKNLSADKARLAVVSTDFKTPASGWTPPDRVLLIESAFPLYFCDNDDLRILAESLLRKLLPDKHPAWDAPQAEWFQWWGRQRGLMLKK